MHKKKKSHQQNMKRQNTASRAEEACYEFMETIATSENLGLNKIIHILCSKYGVRQGDFRKKFYELLQMSPETWYVEKWTSEVDSDKEVDLGRVFRPVSDITGRKNPKNSHYGNKKRNTANTTSNNKNHQVSAWNILLGMVESAKRNMINLQERITNA
jgi:hypothetical protein